MSSIMSITAASGVSAGSIQLNRVLAAQQSSFERLSSGSRLNRPADDPGGAAVALNLRYTSTVLGATEAGMMNALSFLEAQAGELTRVAGVLGRMDELATRLLDPTNAAEDNDTYLMEVNQLREELVKTQSADFNGRKLFLNYQGDTSDQLLVRLDGGARTMALTQSDFNSTNGWIFLLGLTSPYTGLGTDTADGLAAFGQAGFEELRGAVGGMLATNGAETSRVQTALDGVRMKAVAVGEAHSRIEDTDVAREVTQLGRRSILLQSAAAMLTQANTASEVVLKVLGV